MSLKRILRITLMFWSLFFMFQGFCQSDPPVVTAIGNQIYCPQTQQNIVTSFNIVDTDSNSTEAFYIQVSSGYVLGEDQLILSGSHPNVTSNWNAAQAKLTLSPASGSTILYTDIINAVYDVVFICSNLSVGPKTFSLTVGEANFLDGHYYDFVPLYAVPWTTAKANAEAMSYYGLQGYLATITNADEAQICGELSPGTGWIGASDVESEGVWKWVTGPEEGTIFWNGNQNGSAPAGMYSNWNAGEPNNAGNNEDYAHITDVSVTTNPGSWNDLPDSTAGQPPQYTATGFVVEYGGMPGDPELSISASTSFSPAEILSTTPSTSCENEAASLEATSNTTDVLWFDDEFGGNLLHSGNTYNPVLSSNVTFWVLASENGCQTGTRVAVNATVNPSESTTFTPIDSICVGDPNPLPATDINGVTGTWSPAFDPNATTTYTFTPDAGQCAATVDMTIGITPLTIPDYTQISDVCIGTSLTIPTTSNNGIIGTWSPAFDPNTTTTYTFTPNAGQCAATVDMTIGITPLTSPDFTPIADVCIGTSLTIPTTSNNGITGTWSPAFDPTTTTLYTFTPNPNQCANQTTMTIGITPETTSTFSPIAPICEGTNIVLPTASNEGFTGAWNPAFDPNTTTTYTFTPDTGQCASGTTLTVGIIPTVTPTFTPIDPICFGDAIGPLPTTSNNGINGTWFPTTIDNTTTTTYIFTPNGGNCVENTTLEVIVLQQITPTFQIDDICIGETIPSLPNFSQEGISGTWSPAINNLATTTYTFTPDPGQCANSTTETIQVNLISTLAIITENTSAPFESNQIVEVTVTGGSGNYEYQLDGGNWQTSSIFQNVVGCQDHIVKVRDAEGCSNEPESAVTILSYPKFFTPNGDGFNDFWNIKCLRNSTGLVSIFDRFGKLLKQFKTTGSGWNGTYNNNLMPTSDYWFLVTYYDENGIEKEFRSHFTLRR